MHFEDPRLSVDFAYDALGRRLHKNSRAHYKQRPEAGSLWNRNEHARKQRELGCGFTLYGWDGDTLAFESSPAQSDGEPGRTVHYVFEPGTFVPVAQALRHAPIDLIGLPDYSGEYSLDEDPVWNHKATALPFDALAWYQCDHLGTPQELTDSQGNLAWTAQYKAWGQVTEQRSEWARQHDVMNPIRFQGQYHDHETGLHYNRHRYYDPGVGRFISKDPIGYMGGLNLYAYAPNPTGWVDSLGLSATCPCECNKVLEAEGVVTGRHGDLRKIGGLQDSHHIYQDASMNGISGYKYNDAPAISLQGRNPDGTTRGTPHYNANRAQDKASTAGLLGSETVVAFKSLRAAGLSPKAAKCATLQARGYFTGIKANAGTNTATPSKRRSR